MKAFFNKIYSWIKSNKLLAVLILVILFLLMPRAGYRSQFISNKMISPGGSIALDTAGAPTRGMAESVSSYGRGGAIPSYEGMSYHISKYR